MQTMFQASPLAESRDAGEGAPSGINPYRGVRYCRHLRRQQGVSMLELSVALAIICVFLYFLLDRMSYTEEMAEKSIMESTAASLQSALRIETVSRMTRGESNTIEEMALINPVKWLQRPPENYLGELPGPAPIDAQHGTWYYDSKTRVLVYRINMGEYFRSSKPGDPQVRYRVVVEPGSVVATLTPVEPYEWHK